MIIKCISIKAIGGISNSIKYIFKPEKLLPKKKIEKVKKNEKIIYIHGVRMTSKDLQHLEAEKTDYLLLKELENYHGTLDQFIENKISENEKSKSKEIDNSEIPMPEIIKHNLKGKTEKEYIKQFQENEKSRINQRSNQVYAQHTIISFSNNDTQNLTDKMLKDMANEFISLRGIENLYCGSIHKDKEHSHIHLLVSGTQLNGKSSRISKTEFANIKNQLQEYQKLHYPQLISIVEHGKGKNLENNRIEKYKNERSPVKDLLLGCIESSLPNLKSSDDLINILKQHGFETYSRNGKITGVQSKDGYKFRFTRLGISEKLLTLEKQQQKENLALKELQEIRNSRSKDKDKDKSVNKPTEVNKELKELTEIREGKDSELEIEVSL